MSADVLKAPAAEQKPVATTVIPYQNREWTDHSGKKVPGGRAKRPKANRE
jgi:hypothetical protein